MLVDTIITLMSGKFKSFKTTQILHKIKRIYTDEEIRVKNNEVLELHSPILKGTSRIYVTGSGRVTV